ncbi:hypothetical protein [Candidatus Methylocalor cossyra]|uniref:Uncharacterized protein n=1 Tax=Candidatus Methylocalor cossyra TaxID=3108543 RepID=A0ABM9NHT9_9GAMM
MYLEAFIWSWIHLHPGYVLKKSAQLLGLAALILIPLLYVNADLVKRGFKPTPPSFQLEVSQPATALP